MRFGSPGQSLPGQGDLKSILSSSGFSLII